MSPSFASPKVGVGAVIFNGKLKLGEPVKEAAVREVREECHIEIELVDLLGVVDLILKNKNGTVDFHYVLIDYLAKFKSGTPHADSDVTDIGWFSRNELENLDIPSITRKMLEKAFIKINPIEESLN